MQKLSKERPESRKGGNTTPQKVEQIWLVQTHLR